MKLIVGLGNPGRRYARTRHNIGFQAVDRLADAWGIRLRTRAAKSLVGKGEYAGQAVWLAKPLTFMNASGLAVASLVQKLEVRGGDLLVIHDDLDLSPGKLRLRGRGASGGHRGVQSIIQEFGTAEFARLKVGIGRPLVRDEQVVIDYVLHPFSRAERQAIDEALARVPEAVAIWMEHGLEVAMNRINGSTGA